MNIVTVPIGDAHVTSDRNATLVTYALGSCIALAIHDPVAGVGGLLHFMLPDSKLHGDKAQRVPYVYADTGIPLLFRSAYAIGADKNRIAVTVAGGAQMMDDRDTFAIGKRNRTAMRKILWKAGVMIQAEHLGGTVSRTIRLDVSSGKVLMREAGQFLRELPPGPSDARSTL